MDWRDRVRALPQQADPLRFGRHVPPPDFRGRESAVLIALADAGHDLDLLLIERARDGSLHSGQPAFPGGRTEPQDADAVATAMREAQEETGIEPASLEVLAVLPRLHLAVSDFAVTPVVAHWHTPGPVHPADPAEVAAVHRVPVRALVDPSNRVMARHPSGSQGPAFLVAGLVVWGFTAAIIDGLLIALTWDEPWDRARIVDPT